MIVSRRSILAALGMGAAAVVVPELVLEPRRRFWQVARNAPFESPQLTALRQMSYTNLSSRALIVSSSEQQSGTYKLVVDELVLSASSDPPREWFVPEDAQNIGRPIGELLKREGDIFFVCEDGTEVAVELDAIHKNPTILYCDPPLLPGESLTLEVTDRTRPGPLVPVYENGRVASYFAGLEGTIEFSLV